MTTPDTPQAPASALPALAAFLDGLDDQGYRCVTMSELTDHVAQGVA
mgnify:CR=1 FL=1